jgi:hypothetical protein
MYEDPFLTETIAYPVFAERVAPEPPQLPLLLCQGKPFALSPRLGARVVCYVPAGTHPDALTPIEDWAYYHWGNPPLTMVHVTDAPPEVIASTWRQHMTEAPSTSSTDGSL